jgi:hypothetical protein
VRRAQKIQHYRNYCAGTLCNDIKKRVNARGAVILGLTDLREAQWQEFTCERRGGKQMTRKLDGSSNRLTDINASSPTGSATAISGKVTESRGG